MLLTILITIRGGKDCWTEFERISFNGSTSVVLCRPHTGRMHQIRVHLQFLGEDPLLYFTLTFNCKLLTPRPSCCERPTVQPSSVWTGSRSWWGFWRQGRGSVGGGAAGGGKQKLEGDHFCAQVHSADTWLGEEEGPALRPEEPLAAGSLGGRAPAPLDGSLEPKDNKSQHPKYSQNSRMDANCYECSVR